MSDSFFIYVIGRDGSKETDEGPVKVGVSNNPWARLYDLQAGSFVKLELAYVTPVIDRTMAFTVERRIHEKFEADRIHREWFRLRPGDVWYDIGDEIAEYLKVDLGMARDELDRTFDRIMDAALGNIPYEVTFQ